MYDFNFFENYRNKKKKVDKGSRSAMLLVLAFLLLFGGFMGFNFYRMAALQSDMDALQAKLSLPENRETLARLENKQNQLVSLERLVVQLEKVKATTESGDTIQQVWFEKIVAAIPVDLQLTSISMRTDSVEVMGRAPIRSSIAEFQHNLRNSKLSGNLHVSNITYGEDENSFTLFMKMGGEPDAYNQ
ncbi:PilN domain-containing protein [Anaerotalea alkaliphila]|uniref:PilN domain-containing protein n=1 Tax=Anaerotalea alkaliphila TaxID=2662126 RepID=A0A7X5HT99_9FIRM|nr:PilN domain-containing protein [Anaerotalea alkaliphila]NDL66246.1 PilN domain-containing protein [Anaerotalea alkaliphila]